MKSEATNQLVKCILALFPVNIILDLAGVIAALSLTRTCQALSFLLRQDVSGNVAFSTVEFTSRRVYDSCGPASQAR
eukprot:scaffold417751_cov20-Prasinocladus_malaysianus.AAC.1